MQQVIWTWMQRINTLLTDYSWKSQTKKGYIKAEPYIYLYLYVDIDIDRQIQRLLPLYILITSAFFFYPFRQCAFFSSQLKKWISANISKSYFDDKLQDCGLRQWLVYKMLSDSFLSIFHVWCFIYVGVDNLTTDHFLFSSKTNIIFQMILTVLTKTSLDFQVSQMPKAYYFLPFLNPLMF